MLKDLKERIQELQRENHEILLIVDWNEDIRGQRLTNFRNRLQLKEAILSRHGERHAPSTYIDPHLLIVSSPQEVSAYREVDTWHSQRESKANRIIERHGLMLLCQVHWATRFQKP
jgi:hypothetical protein